MVGVESMVKATVLTRSKASVAVSTYQYQFRFEVSFWTRAGLDLRLVLDNTRYTIQIKADESPVLKYSFYILLKQTLAYVGCFGVGEFKIQL